jgi:mono/diheme cytochrome c family protein
MRRQMAELLNPGADMMATRIAAVLTACFLYAAPAGAQKGAAAALKAAEHYRLTCQPCHGVEGKGVVPLMSLADGEWKHGSSTQNVAKTIANGVKGTAMLPFKDKFTRAEILELAKLVRSFDKRLKSAGPAKAVKSGD